MEDLENIRDRVRRLFFEDHGIEPRMFRSPGRVNLIGEHTDYNDGFVLPFAIDRETVVAGTPRSDTKINVRAVDVGESFAFDLNDPAKKRRGGWADYVEGVARSLQENSGLKLGADLVFSSTVPIGGGLSSSAALEVSIGYALLALNGTDIDRMKLAFAAQRAEHDFVGTRSGIMDQFAAVFSRKDNALLLDCRSLETQYIPLAIGEAAFAICNTKVRHQLASSEYNTRRAECEKGVLLLSSKLPAIKSLRDVTHADLDDHRSLLPDPIARRCRHVVTEIARTLQAAKALSRKDLREAGRLMYLSHGSLRDDYEVSCPELDTLVETASKIDGVYGSRMTGGGFGGCTITLVDNDSLEEFRQAAIAEYEKEFGFAPGFFVVSAADGTSEIG